MAEKSTVRAKGRKIGRQKRKPCHLRYNQEQRWNKNKLRRAKKTARKFGCPVVVKINGHLETVLN